MGRGDALQNGLGMGNDVFAFLQRLFFPRLQCGGINGIHFCCQSIHATLFVRLVGIQRIQLPLHRHQFPIALIVLGKKCPVLRVLVQKPQMQGRIRQALAVMLSVDCKEPCRNIPYNAGRCGHSVDTATALSLCVDLTV